MIQPGFHSSTIAMAISFVAIKMVRRQGEGRAAYPERYVTDEQRSRRPIFIEPSGPRPVGCFSALLAPPVRSRTPVLKVCTSWPVNPNVNWQGLERWLGCLYRSTTASGENALVPTIYALAIGCHSKLITIGDSELVQGGITVQERRCFPAKLRPPTASLARRYRARPCFNRRDSG
jgi:hypothetical protein